MAPVTPTSRALGWIGGALAELDASGLRRRPGHRCTPAGRLADGLVNLASNDYLGLAGDPRLADAAARAARRWGAGAAASRLITGGTELHRELEAAIASWKGTEDAVVFSSGYLANVGTIPALVGPGDVVCSDELNHASIIDGCRLSRAEVRVYPHGDLGALDALLGGAPARARRLVVVDGVFSMDGDAADLPGLGAVARRHGAMVMVDDAHGCGVLGPDGRGTAAEQGCAGAIHVQLGTLSKAFGAAGGYVAGSRDLCEWLRNRARGFVFDTAPAPAVVGAALEGLRIAAAEPWRRERATALARRLATGLAAPAEPAPAGPPPADPAPADPAPAPTPAACIVPLIVGDAAAALALSARLAEAGLLVVAIRPPTVPDGTARLRFSLTAAHTDGDVDAAVRATRGVSTSAAPRGASRHSPG